MIKDTTLASSPKYPLDKEDFSEVQFHKIMYVTLHNLSEKGVKCAEVRDIVDFISPYESHYEIFKDMKGTEYVEVMGRLSEVNNFEYYYNKVRKYSLLRELKKSGDDISKYWNDNTSDEENFKNLEDVTITDILSDLENRAIERKRKYGLTKVKEEYVAGTDFMETKEQMKTSPLIGSSFQSEFLNDIYRGMFGFTLRGAPSGNGKSVLSFGDLCKCTVTEYWDYETQSFVRNKSREGAGLFINTELELRTQLDLIAIAWISGVDRSHINDGKYEDGEEERVDYASKILLESELYLVDDPEFTTLSLTETIKSYVYSKNVKTVCFDYVSNNGYVAKEISNETKIPQREDMVLLTLTDRLKQVQRDMDICLISSVQTNGKENEMDNPNESCLAGGKSQIRKTDACFIMLKPTKKELEQVSSLCAKVSEKGFGNIRKPNNVLHIIKGRNSKYPKYIKVFQEISLGTGRSIDLFCTDMYNKHIQVDRRIIEVED
jgi:replicative DNA helicase